MMNARKGETKEMTIIPGAFTALCAFWSRRALLSRADALRPNRAIAYDANTKEGSRQITKG